MRWYQPGFLDCIPVMYTLVSDGIATERLFALHYPIPMGRKNWLFCWTEVGAEYVDKIQSLLVTCRLHGIAPYTYFVDVLQRISITKAHDVADLTPLRWKELFARDPLSSDLDMQ
jgi:hypothetical protein